MKTPMEILLPKIKEAENNELKGLFCDNKLYIIQAMEEYAQIKVNELNKSDAIKLVYCDCEVGKCEGREASRCALKNIPIEL